MYFPPNFFPKISDGVACEFHWINLCCKDLASTTWLEVGSEKSYISVPNPNSALFTDAKFIFAIYMTFLNICLISTWAVKNGGRGAGCLVAILRTLLWMHRKIQLRQREGWWFSEVFLGTLGLLWEPSETIVKLGNPHSLAPSPLKNFMNHWCWDRWFQSKGRGFGQGEFLTMGFITIFHHHLVE